MNVKELSKYSILPLRIILGSVFIFHGYGKLFGTPGLEGFSGMLNNLGVPLAYYTAILVALIEFIGGIAILVGFKTRAFAFLIGFVMVIALLLVHIKQGWANSEFPLSLLVIAISLILSGPGNKFVMKK